MGRPRDDLAPDVRSFVHGNYVIYFRYGPKTVEIVAVLECHRDAQAMFSRPPGG